jgi:hypothetical protein
LSGDTDLSPLVKVWAISCGLMFLVGAPVCAYLMLHIFREARASADWPHATGRINRVEVLETDLGLRSKFRTDVAYEYPVQGRLYSGTRIRPKESDWDSRTEAENALKGLVPGQKIEVYYRPDDPSQSVLRPGARFQDYALLTIPFVMLALGVGSLAMVFLNRGG